MQEFWRSSVKFVSGRKRRACQLLGAFWLVAGVACATAPPQNVENICSIFEEKKSWYKAAKKSEARWGTPKHVQMAIIRQLATRNARKKDWLKETARQVDYRAREWGAQPKRCEADLDDGWWIF